MSYNSDKGYSAERAMEVWWNERGRPVHRPRAGAALDKGDLAGLPIVQSVKNHKALKLSTWVDGMVAQVANTDFDLGVVWHKRPGKGHPSGWYMTTRGDYGLALVEAYVDGLVKL